MPELSRTCIEEACLECVNPALSQDKGYVSRIYERADGKYAWRYGWGKRFSSFQYQEEVFDSRSSAYSKHSRKLDDKRNQGTSKGRYVTCTPSNIGVQSELATQPSVAYVVAQTPPTPYPGPQPAITSHPSRLRVRPAAQSPAAAAPAASLPQLGPLPEGATRYIDWDD